MREPLFFMTDAIIPTRAMDLLPAVRRAVDELRDHFELSLGDTPWEGAPEEPVQLFLQHSSGKHVLAMEASLEALLANIRDQGSPRSIIAAGAIFTSVNRRVLGMPPSAVADAFDASRFHTDTTYSFIRVFTQGASDTFQRMVANAFDAEIDWKWYRDVITVHNPQDFDLSGLTFDVPALYLRSRVDFPGTEEAMHRLFPNLEVDRIDQWPVRLHEAGIELVSKVIPFIQKHATRDP
jgi:hypothetical protein